MITCLFFNVKSIKPIPHHQPTCSAPFEFQLCKHGKSSRYIIYADLCGYTYAQLWVFMGLSLYTCIYGGILCYNPVATGIP